MNNGDPPPPPGPPPPNIPTVPRHIEAANRGWRGVQLWDEHFRRSWLLDTTPRLENRSLCLVCGENGVEVRCHPCGCPLSCLNCTAGILGYNNCVICGMEIDEAKLINDTYKESLSQDGILYKTLKRRYGDNLPSNLRIVLDNLACKNDKLCFVCAKNKARVISSPCGCAMSCLKCSASSVKDASDLYTPAYHFTCLICLQEANSMEEIEDDADVVNPIFNEMLQAKCVDGKLKRNGQFFKDYMKCSQKNTCFGCDSPMNWSNSPCGCPMWCGVCKLKVEAFPEGHKDGAHLCPLCNEPVTGHSVLPHMAKGSPITLKHFMGSAQQGGSQTRKKERMERKRQGKEQADT